jgi:DNA invertase Pin-like site-specific DNA recombinase
LLEATRRREIDVILVWVRDRLASIVRGLFEIRDHSNHLGIEVVCWREQLYTDGPLGRAGLVIVSAVFKLERSLIVERVQAR